jgi:hypothetical protein
VASEFFGLDATLQRKAAQRAGNKVKLCASAIADKVGMKETEFR